MPTADATLLPPPLVSDDYDTDVASTRSLDGIGVHAVLGAMVAAKKRASQPCAYEVAGEEREESPRRRAPMQSEVFLKAR